MNLVAVAGDGGLTLHGKQAIAKSMLHKGFAFFGSYILLRQNNQSEPTEYVALHNLCQAIELILKSLLLIKDYDLFQPKLKKIGHNLPDLAKIVTKEYSRRKLSLKTMSQLTQLNELYRNNRLRYGNGLDLLIAPHSIERKRIVRLLAHVVKRAEI